MRTICLATVLGMLGIGVAVAADMPLIKAPRPAATWTGFYVGGTVGARSDTGVAATQSIAETVTGLDPCNNGSNCNFDQHLAGVGFRYGAFTGYNWQVSPEWLVGLEGDFGWASIRSKITGMTFPGGAFLASGDLGDSFALHSTWDSSARARFGYLATPSLLFYLTAGAAALHFGATATCSSADPQATCFPLNPPAFSITSSTTKIGWTAGGGLEALLWSNWFARAEYRFADFTTATFADSIFSPAPRNPINVPGTTTATYTVQMQTHTVTFGIGYRFGPI